MTKCIECPHFKVDYSPYVSNGVCWDFGRASCKQYDMVVDWRTEKKLKRLTCVKEDTTQSSV